MAKFLNVFLSGLGIFFVAFAWVYYCLKEAQLALLLALLLAMCASYVLYKIITDRECKLSAKKQAKNKITALSNYLCFCHELPTLFADLLKYYTFQVQKVQNDGIVATKNGKTTFLSLLFENDTLTKQEVVKSVVCAKKEKAERLIVFCNGATNQLQQLANQQLPTRFVDVANTYALFEQADKLPALPNIKQKKSAYFACFAFSKKRFGGYLGGAIFMLLTSALTFFPIYSIVWATVLLGLALYSLLNKKYNVTPTAVTLE